MSGRTVSHYVITCDGCGKTIGDHAEFTAAVEARAWASDNGWLLVPQVLSNGRQARVSTSQPRFGDDVCPDCGLVWEPKQADVPWGGSSWMNDPDQLRARATRLERR